MKTPREIVDSLERCGRKRGFCNDFACAYSKTNSLDACISKMHEDAAKLIQDMEIKLAMYGGEVDIAAVYEERDRLADENGVLRDELTANSKHKTTSDMVNHPPHYESGKYECIDVMEEVYGTEIVKNFCLCNAFKYLYRCMHKHDSPTEDTKKSAWYLEKYFELGDRSNDD